MILSFDHSPFIFILSSTSNFARPSMDHRLIMKTHRGLKNSCDITWVFSPSVWGCSSVCKGSKVWTPSPWSLCLCQEACKINQHILGGLSPFALMLLPCLADVAFHPCFFIDLAGSKLPSIQWSLLSGLVDIRHNLLCNKPPRSDAHNYGKR
jgi:hypothetical protein